MEIPLEEEEAEEEAKPEMPEKRVPYSMHIVTQLPQHKHLHEESNARKFIEDKLVGAFENFEDLIRHVEASGTHANKGSRELGAKPRSWVFGVVSCVFARAHGFQAEHSPGRSICRCPHTSTARSARTRCPRPR